MKPTNLICEVKFGSHLYGTATEQSDEDWKGIFLPTLEEIILGRIPKTAASTTNNDSRKNEAGELDCEYYSLHHFLRLATQGQTVAIDMLFAPDDMVVKSKEYGWIWDRIVSERKRFLSKQMGAFVGYARGQAAKYSLKGERLNDLKTFRDMLSGGTDAPYRTLELLWEELPKDDERVNPQGIRELQIAGKWFGETTACDHALQTVNKAIQRYGKRANASANAEGVDWKAMSHAVRVSKELLEILETGHLVFPLQEAELLLDIKLGKRSIEEVSEILDRDLAVIEQKAIESKLPDGVDHKWADRFLMQLMMDHMAHEIVSVMEGHEEER